jgi:hypothetical protein
VRIFWLLLLLSSCVSVRGPQPSETILNQDTRDWVKVYAQELEAARQNNDLDAWRFFWPEYLKEREKQRNQ